MPTIEPGDTIRLAAQNLIVAMQNMHKQAPIDLTPQHTDALKQLAEIFSTTAGHTSQITKDNTPALSVKPYPSTSHNATSLRVIKAQTVVDEQVTRNNKPMPTMKEMNDRQDPKPLIELTR